MVKFSEKTITNIVTVGGVGFWPKAPGTWGSLVVIVVALALYVIEMVLNAYVPTGFFKAVCWIALLITPFISFALGWWATKHYQALTGKQDASEIVIDEVAGQSLTLLLSLPAWVWVAMAGFMDGNNELLKCWLLSSFILFRFFDMLKPWPICLADRKWKGAFGVMFDDMLAGMMAAGVMWLGVWLWLG